MILYIRKYIRTTLKFGELPDFSNKLLQKELILKKKLQLLNNMSSLELLELKSKIVKDKTNTRVFLKNLTLWPIKIKVYK